MTVLPSLPPSVYVSTLVAFAAAVFLVLTKHWHGHFSMDGLLGVQKMHSVPTPRIGGVAIVLGVFAGYLVAPVQHKSILEVLLLAGLPAFLFGLAEDVTKKVGVNARLLATMGSGALGWWLTGMSITGINLPGIDTLLTGSTVVSVAFTAFAVGGVANAINIVDGFNGLASGFVAFAFAAVTAMSLAVGDTELAVACLSMAGAVVGFWLLNWPWGKLFLGDGGSYFGGFALAWACVMLIERHPNITAFAPLLICIHPITEVLFSIYRRSVRKAHPGLADRLHLHSLIMRRVVRPMLTKVMPDDAATAIWLCNPATGLLLALMSLPACLAAYIFMQNTLGAAIACGGFMAGYLLLYTRVVRFKWAMPWA